MATLFTENALRSAAGDRVFDRGRAYHREGRVKLTRCSPSHIQAIVRGNEDYRVELDIGGGGLVGTCSCPAFETADVCKHMVAVALSVSARVAEAGDAMPHDRIRTYLSGLDTTRLIDLLLDAADRDEELGERLELDAALATEDDATLEKRLSAALTKATRTGRFIDYRHAPRWAAGIEVVLDAIGQLAAGPRAPAARRLAEKALERIAKAMGEIDDSDGHIGGLLGQAAKIHLEACTYERPDPILLARYLFKAETESDHDTFVDAASTYAKVLGPTGTAEHRRLATRAWEALPPIRARGSTDYDARHEYRVLAGMLSAVAERSGNVDQLIEIRTKCLASPWDYLQLAELCRSKGRGKDALRWAEEGAWLFEDDRPDERLIYFLAEVLQEAKRIDEAATHLRRLFNKAPSIETYERLKRVAGQPAAADCMTHLWDLVLKRAERPAGLTALLAEILLMERQPGAAWSAAEMTVMTSDIRLKLADATGKAFPEKALATYAAQIDHAARLGGRGNYVWVKDLLQRMAKLQSPSAHAAYVEELKLKHSRKRSLIQLLG
jgi:uncharacterized Zn finger protein